MAEEDEVEGITTWSLILRFIVLIGAFLFFIVMRGRIGQIVFDRAFVISSTIIFLWFAAKTSLAALKHASPQVVWNSGHDSFTGNYYNYGNFGVIRLGGIRSFGFEYEGNAGVLMFPLTAITKIGKSAVISVRTEETPLEKVPSDIAAMIVQYGLNPPYLCGYANEEQYMEQIDDASKISGLSKPSVDYLIKELKERNNEVSMLRRMLSGKFGVVEDVVSSASRIRQTAKEESLLNVIKQKLKEEEG